MTIPLKLGIPKGSLQNSTFALFKRSGWIINVNDRSYCPEINDDTIECTICRAQEMSRYVENGTLDAGLTGKDWIAENSSDVHVVEDLIYSKVSARPARWVLAVPYDSPIKSLDDLNGKKVATELVAFTKRYFDERDISVKVEFSWGATEAKVVSGLADAVVEVTETGSTIKAHGLRIVCDILHTETRLIANKQAMQDPWKREKIEQIATLLQAALTARQKVALKMNVPADQLELVVGMLPSLHAPTVSHLYDQEWLAIETVVNSGEVRDLIPRLKAAGAEGILEYELRKMI